MLNKILDTKDSSIITLNNLTSEFFSDYVKEFDFIKTHLQQYSIIPDKETFLSVFPDFDIMQVNEPVNYLLEELMKDKTQRFLVNNYTKVRDYIMNGESEKAMSLLQDAAEESTSFISLQATDLIEDKSRFDSYEDKVNNPDKYFIKTGFAELDNILGGWDVNEDLVTIVARNGLGKCFEKGTKCLMADGTIKKIEDIKPGDKVQSEKGVNTVEACHNGKAKGYKIIPKLGEPFVVSAQHILTLVNTDFWQLFDITIEQYMALCKRLSKHDKNKYQLYKPGVRYAEKPIERDPFTLGCSVVNDLTASIPLNYLTAPAVYRFSLLKGIIKTGGRIKHNKCNIHLHSEVVAAQTAQLVRGLGFAVEQRCCDVIIYGKNLTKAAIRKPVTTPFTIEELDEIEYYGFQCGGDHRFLLADNTLVHNSWIALKCAAAAAEQGKVVGVYSGEMSEDTVGYRIDSILGHISNGALVHGSGSIKNQYKNYLEKLSQNIPGKLYVLTPKQINGPATVTALRAFIEKYKLEVLFIDQHSLLEDESGAKNPVEKASNISKQLKLLQTVKRIPIISVSQQNREKLEEGKTFDTTQIAQSDRIAQDSSVIIFLERKDDLMKLHLVKSRQSGSGQILTYKIDLNQGIWQPIVEGDSEAPIMDGNGNTYSEEDVF